MDIETKTSIYNYLISLKRKMTRNKSLLFSEYLPFIMTLNNNGYSSSEIADFLNEKCNLIISRQSISKLLSDFFHGKLNKKFLDIIVLFIPKDKLNDLKIKTYAIQTEFGYYITLRKVNYPKEWILTRDKINYLKSPLGMLIAKRLMGWYDINDVTLVENFSNSEVYKEIYQTQLNEINNIVDYFQIFYNKLKIELQNKNHLLFNKEIIHE